MTELVKLARNDDLLEPLRGLEIPSEVDPSVTYRVDRTLGYGGLSVSFLASRKAAGGEVNVVLKVLRPSIVRKLGGQASLIVRKEAVALGRLNEQMPPTPFVVRLVDAGSVEVEREGKVLELPWTAVEHVDGGTLGTTLAERVRHSINERGHAFSSMRASHAIDCIAQGLSAAHAQGVIHRDLAPHAVLCTGSGLLELFKIADFGAARAAGLEGTLGAWVIGTPGYVAPEHAGLIPKPAGTWTDVYGFAAVIYFMLTGEQLHIGDATADRLASLLDSKTLAPELRKREAGCRAIDQILAWGSALKPEMRLAEPFALASLVGQHLRASPLGEAAPRASAAHLSSPPPAPQQAAGWSWTWLQQPERAPVMRSVAWDGYGRALAATASGIWFWDGTLWEPVEIEGLGATELVDFVGRAGAGRWALCCRDGSLAVCTVGGVTARVRGPGGEGRYRGWSGDLDDIGVLVTALDGEYSLHTLVGKRWLKPLRLEDSWRDSGLDAASFDISVSAVSRLDDAKWMVAGRKGQRGFVAIYTPLAWELEPIDTPSARAFLACDGLPTRHIGVAVGLGGTVLFCESVSTRHEQVTGRFDISAVALNPGGRPWAAGSGRIWAREPDASWRPMWSDPDRELPVVSLACDVDRVHAIFADGSILAGRASPRVAGRD